jgi:hypothetical protein
MSKNMLRSTFRFAIFLALLGTILLASSPDASAQQQPSTKPAKPQIVTLPADEMERLNKELREKQKVLWSHEAIDPKTRSNGCGPQWLMTLLKVLPEARRERYKTIANVRSFAGWNSETNTMVPFPVDFKPACDLHDTGYAGLHVIDEFGKGPNASVDFSTWTKEKVDEKFLVDLRKICDRTITTNSQAKDKCKGETGAKLYYELVSTVGYISFDCNLNDSIVTIFREFPPQFCTRRYTENGWFVPVR